MGARYLSLRRFGARFARWRGNQAAVLVREAGNNGIVDLPRPNFHDSKASKQMAHMSNFALPDYMSFGEKDVLQPQTESAFGFAATRNPVEMRSCSP